MNHPREAGANIEWRTVLVKQERGSLGGRINGKTGVPLSGKDAACVGVLAIHSDGRRGRETVSQYISNSEEGMR